MVLRYVLFFGLMLLLLGAMARYVQQRSAGLFRLGATARRAVGGALGLAMVLAVLARVLDGRLPSSVLTPVGLGSFAVVLGILLVWLPLTLLHGGFGLARRLERWRESRHPPSERRDDGSGTSPGDPDVPMTSTTAGTDDAAERKPGELLELSRRAFLEQASAAAVLAAGFGSAGYGTFVGRRAWTLERVALRIPGLSSRFDGFVVVQLSDLHIGSFVREDALDAAERLAAQAHADLIVLTGDMLDNDPRYAPQLERFTGRLRALAPAGVVAIAGNHDYYAGIDETMAAVERGGGRVLRNSGEVVGDGENGIALLGVDDVWGPRVDPRSAGPDLEACLRALPPQTALPRVLLCHNPILFPTVADRIALQLSGHTHGSQVNVGHPLTSLVLRHPYIAGHHRLAASQLYVNRGFGTAGPPARIGSPPEVTRLVLHAA